MALEIKIKGLENLISEIRNFAGTIERWLDIRKSHPPTIKCRGPKIDKREVSAFIIYKPSETEIRCARYDKDYRKCRDPQLEKDTECETLPFCIYIDAEYKV